MAQYSTTSELYIHRARSRLEYLIEKQKTFEIIEKKPKRSLSQNALFHLWIGVFADEIGNTSLESVKRDVKRELFRNEQ